MPAKAFLGFTEEPKHPWIFSLHGQAQAAKAEVISSARGERPLTDAALSLVWKFLETTLTHHQETKDPCTLRKGMTSFGNLRALMLSRGLLDNGHVMRLYQVDLMAKDLEAALSEGRNPEPSQTLLSLQVSVKGPDPLIEEYTLQSY